ncbi:hypothetical protein HA461_20490 [Rhizobium leguminosarum bv. trifolii]|uniref:hypothetical protein n=1 Tax=Rhizobium leguminosarum TaxID=384 RepID=UPI00140FCED3|nr:hypothetical protein [Rhizobium leguminosarum]QIO53401.1 hypothetical protein HA461_20490 [Rhizobium leguminosarum bv. trifolii]
MQTDHKPDGGRAASLIAGRFGTKPETQIDYAVDLLRTVHLALRARDYHDDRDVEAISDVTSLAIDIIADALAEIDKRTEGGQ